MNISRMRKANWARMYETPKRQSLSWSDPNSDPIGNLKLYFQLYKDSVLSLANTTSHNWTYQGHRK